jgi:hypothetical protein
VLHVPHGTNPDAMRTCTLTAALLTSICSFAQSVPVFYWPLDELAGTVAQDHAGTSDGQLQGNTEWQPIGGHHSGALRFNGNDARVDLGPCDITTGSGDQLSLACWFKPEIVSGTERILMAKTIGPNEEDFIWSLSLVNNTGARFRVRAGGVLHTIEIPPSSIFSNTWYHLAGTYDGTTLRLFLNGSTAANGVAEGAIGYHPQAPATLGNLYDNSMPFFGSLDDVRIYDREIVGLEVIDLVIGDVAMTVDDAPVTVRPDGSLLLPPGNWDGLRLLDASGRMLLTDRINDGQAPSLSAMPAGLYLVCLQGRDGATVRRVVLP